MGKSRKREREKSLREYERQLAWQRQQEAKKHRRNVIAGTVTASVLVIALVGWAVAAALTSPTPAASAGATSTPQAYQTPDATGAETPAAETASAAPEATPGNEGAVPPASEAESRAWTGTVKTTVGDLGITLDGARAPQAVASFVSLAKKGFFNGTTCHRLTTGDGFKVLQCGDPEGNGRGGPAYSFGPIENAPSDGTYRKGTIAMARVGNNAYSMGSQFFIVYGDTVIPNDSVGGYTVFGEVTSGIDEIEKVGAAGTKEGSQDGTPKTTVTIEGVSVK